MPLLPSALRGDVDEALAALQPRRIASQPLPPADGQIDIEGIELHPAGEAPDPLAGDQRRAGAGEGIEDEVAAGRGVKDRDKRHRLWRRVLGGEIALLALPAEPALAWVGPDIGAVAAVLAQLDVVAVRRVARLEHEHQNLQAAAFYASPRGRSEYPCRCGGVRCLMILFRSCRLPCFRLSRAALGLYDPRGAGSIIVPLVRRVLSNYMVQTVLSQLSREVQRRDLVAGL
jgi:hypothetical protein